MKDPQQLLAESEDLGLALKPGDPHYRAYVGPPRDYDLVAAMSFNLLTTLGLRQCHSLLDIGCGSLRVGRLLIPYLNRGSYVGFEPNEWLVKHGIQREVGEDLVEIKRPRFVLSNSPEDLLHEKVTVDYALAQSIFSHCGMDLVARWLAVIERILSPEGALVGTFVAGEEDSSTPGWIYPGCVSYKMQTMEMAAATARLRFEALDWRHPRQTWALFAKAEFKSDWFKNQSLTWNNYLEKELKLAATQKSRENRKVPLPNA